jgi:Zn-dependent metalloprotease
MHRCRNPLFCVVPPYVLSEVANRGSERQRTWALRTLQTDVTIRHARSVNAKTRGRKGRVEGPDALAAAAAAAGTGRSRMIWDAKGSWEITGIQRVRDEDDGPTGDPAADEAFDGFGATFDFWQAAFSRDSIDNENMPLRGVVHFGEEYPNAFWDGRRMVFGDGDNELFLRFTKSLDVIGHELGHGVIEDEAGLEYWGQSGALNEHFADVAGVMVKQRKLGQTADQADWLIGAELRGDEFDGDAIRSMSAPGTAYDDACLGKDPQPAHWRDYVRTFEDNGGVHINSGIPNKAFYLLATNLGVKSWHAPGHIWYDALRSPLLTTTSTFRQFARITHRAARQRFGVGSDQAKAVRQAWEEVGVRWE